MNLRQSTRGPDQFRDQRRSVWRRLTLTGPGGRTFLDRRGIDLCLFGIYVHRITAPDPGLDLHDHPWPFVSLVLRGGYTEQVADTREAVPFAEIAERYPDTCTAGVVRSWRRFSTHRMPLTVSHRITEVEPGTITLIVRGRKSRRWGFYLPSGYVDQDAYDYRARRPAMETR